MSRERFRTALVVAAFVASAAAFAFLPGRLPHRFGVPSGPDIWVSRAISAFFLPSVALVVSALLRRLAAADPLRANHDRFRATYDLTLNAGVLFIVGLHATVLTTLLVGVRPWLGYIPPLLAGVLAIAVGNVLPRVRPNSVVGIATPWTLRDERVWAITHRTGGYVLVLFGLLVIAATVLVRPWLGWIVGLGTGATVLVLLLVSCLAWRAVPGGRPEKEPVCRRSPPGGFT